MGDFINLVFRLLFIIVNALEVYNETEEGHAALNDLLSDIEDEGFDIPFWEPDPEEGNGQPPLDLNAVSDLTDKGVQAIRDAWLKRHANDNSTEGEGL